MVASLLTGLLTGLTLIVALGAQNAFVLRQGLLRQHVTTVVGISLTLDAVLILVGTAGMGALVTRHPGAVRGVTVVGAIYLLGYGALALRRAVRGADPQTVGPAPGRGSVALTTTALALLNPHVYLDTVVMLGAMANTHGDARWAFAAGAVLASLTWFVALGYGATRLSGTLSSARAWRIIDLVIALTMAALALTLLMG